MSRRIRSENSAQGIPEATIARLPLYLRALYALADRDVASVSSETCHYSRPVPCSALIADPGDSGSDEGLSQLTRNSHPGAAAGATRNGPREALAPA